MGRNLSWHDRQGQGDDNQVPVPYVPIMYKKPHWKSTVFVTLIVLLVSVLTYAAEGVRGTLMTILLTITFTGAYVVLTGRSSWAHVRGGRLMGLTLVATSILGVVGVQNATTQGVSWFQAADDKDAHGTTQPKQLPISAYVPQQPTHETLPESVPVAEDAPHAPVPVQSPEPVPADEPNGEVDYENCSAVWDALGRPISIGEPGYHTDLDKDSDGVGCEEDPR